MVDASHWALWVTADYLWWVRLCGWDGGWCQCGWLVVCKPWLMGMRCKPWLLENDVWCGCWCSATQTQLSHTTFHTVLHPVGYQQLTTHTANTITSPLPINRQHQSTTHNVSSSRFLSLDIIL